MKRSERDQGAAVIWVLAACVLVFGIGYAAAIRTTAVLARHRAASAADLAVLAGAGQIGVTGQVCPAAERVAAANSARVVDCLPSLAPDGRSGTVTVRVRLTARLPVVGSRSVIASARAERVTSSGRG